MPYVHTWGDFNAYFDKMHALGLVKSDGDQKLELANASPEAVSTISAFAMHPVHFKGDAETVALQALKIDQSCKGILPSSLNGLQHNEMNAAPAN